MSAILFFCTDYYGNNTQKQSLVVLFQNNLISGQPMLPQNLQPRRCLRFMASNNGVSWKRFIPVPDLPLMYILQTDERQPPVGCNPEADNCYRPFASPLNKKEHPGCSCGDRANAPRSDKAIPLVSGTMKQNSNPSMKNRSKPKCTVTNASSIELCRPWMKP